jgi:hypothetical protein
MSEIVTTYTIVCHIWFFLRSSRGTKHIVGMSRGFGINTSLAMQTQSCHPEERGISARNSVIKIHNLCRATYGDPSFLGMTRSRLFLHFLNRIYKSFNGLRSGNGIFSIKDKKRNTLHANFLRFFNIVLNVF